MTIGGAIPNRWAQNAAWTPPTTSGVADVLSAWSRQKPQGHSGAAHTNATAGQGPASSLATLGAAKTAATGGAGSAATGAAVASAAHAGASGGGVSGHGAIAGLGQQAQAALVQVQSMEGAAASGAKSALAAYRTHALS